MSRAQGLMGAVLLALFSTGSCSGNCPRQTLQRCPNAAATQDEPEPEPEPEPAEEADEPDDGEEDARPAPKPAKPAAVTPGGLPPANTKVEPPGSGWWCHEARDRGTGTFLGARCNRRQAECETAKAQLLARYKSDGVAARIELGACESRVRADCFTAFDISYDQYAYFCFDSTKDCAAARKNMERKNADDYRELSRCDPWY